MHYLYKITCLANGKIYIGQTGQEPAKRWEFHCNDAAGIAKMPIHRAIKKYGPETFSFEVIDKCLELAEANQLEIDYIKQYNSLISGGNGYNVEPGGGNTKERFQWGAVSY